MKISQFVAIAAMASVASAQNCTSEMSIGDMINLSLDIVEAKTTVKQGKNCLPVEGSCDHCFSLNFPGEGVVIAPLTSASEAFGSDICCTALEVLDEDLNSFDGCGVQVEIDSVNGSSFNFPCFLKGSASGNFNEFSAIFAVFAALTVAGGHL